MQTAPSGIQIKCSFCSRQKDDIGTLRHIPVVHSKATLGRKEELKDAHICGIGHKVVKSVILKTKYHVKNLI